MGRNKLDPSHPLWKKAVRIKDIRRIDGLIGATLYRVHPEVSLNDVGFLTSTAWVLVNFETTKEQRTMKVTSVYAARRTGRLYYGPREIRTGSEISFTHNELRTVRGWDHQKVLSNLEFKYAITKPRYAVGSNAPASEPGYFWDDSGPTSLLMAKKFFEKSDAENFVATKVMFNPRLLGKFRIVNV